MKTKSPKEYLKKRLKKKAFVDIYANVEFLVKIGVALSKAREQAKLSQSQMAKLLNTTQSVVSRIENGNQNLSLSMLAMISRVLGCKFSIQLNSDQIAA